MQLTQLEKNTIIALGEHGAMGVSTLMPLVDGLESKVQLKNVLEGLKTKGLAKQQPNSQWVVLKATYKDLIEHRELIGAVRVEKPTSEAPASKEQNPLKDIPTTKDIGRTSSETTANTVVQKTSGATVTIEPEVADTVPEDPAPVSVIRNKPDNKALSLATLLSTLPEDTEISLSNSGLNVWWNGVGKFQPSTEELPCVLSAIETLQTHRVGIE